MKEITSQQYPMCIRWTRISLAVVANKPRPLNPGTCKDPASHSQHGLMWAERISCMGPLSQLPRTALLRVSHRPGSSPRQ